MDVRGPNDSHSSSNKLSQIREQLRFEGAEGTPTAKLDNTSSPQSEIGHLTQQLRELPEVRAELVAASMAKLREGHFSTRESAERTADAVLRTLTKE